jgi:hypothetical protein
MKTVLLMILLTGVMSAQATLPPAPLPNLPANVSQTVLISGSFTCPTGFPSGGCTQVSGSNWYLVSQGGSGGIHYDSAGNLIIGVTTSDGKMSLIFKMAPDGTPSPFINFPATTTSGCKVISPSSLIASGEEYMQSPFSFNPALTSLFVVTANTNTVITWDPSTSSGVCLSSYPGAYQITGSSTMTHMFTLAVIELTGSGL